MLHLTLTGFHAGLKLCHGTIFDGHHEGDVKAHAVCFSDLSTITAHEVCPVCKLIWEHESKPALAELEMLDQLEMEGQ